MWFFEETGLLGVLDCLLGVLGYGLGVPDCYWAFSAMDWAFPIPIGRSRLWIGRSQGDYSSRLSEGDYSKETIRRRLSEETIRRRLFEGVAHTICFGVVPEHHFSVFMFDPSSI